jgi:hypothetical protein
MQIDLNKMMPDFKAGKISFITRGGVRVVDIIKDGTCSEQYPYKMKGITANGSEISGTVTNTGCWSNPTVLNDNDLLINRKI